MAACAASLAVVFRVSLLSGFGQTWGSTFDGGIEAAILEHWFNVLRGAEAWNRTGWFFPYGDTLGYNDGYLIYGVLHAAFRRAGADIFVASALVDMAVRAIGFAGMFAFLRRAAGCRHGFAVFGAALFTVAHGPFLHGLHQQLLSVAFAPVLGWLVWEAWAALRAGRPRAFALWGAAAGVLWGAWLLTAFYMAWFTTLFACAMAVVAAVVAGPAGVRGAAAAVLRWRWHCVAVAGVAVAAAVPFLLVYLPKLAETGGQSWRETLYFTPRPNDVVNLGATATLWGRLYPVLCPLCTRNSFEMTTGITPVLLWLFAAGVLGLALRRDGEWRDGEWRDGERRGLLLVAGVAAVVLGVVLVRWGAVTGWWLVWKLVPGAGGVRVVSRLLLFLVAPVVVVAVAHLQHLADRGADRGAGRVPRHVVVLLAGLMLVEQAEPGAPMYTRSAELARLQVPAAPAECRAFYVGAAEGSEGEGEIFRIYPHNVTAMLLSERLGLPTINGHSTFDPPDWNFADPLRGDYEARVRAYAERHGIAAGLCRLDLKAKQWGGAG